MFDYAVGALNWWYNVGAVKASLTKTASPLRCGILGAAAISFSAFIDPTQTHPDARVTAIAARNVDRAQAQIRKYKLGPDCKAYGSYAELLASPDIDAVYIPLPNGLHAEWTIKALQAGKHVLVEKPIASNADEARAIAAAAQKAGKVALEAFHWRFHPAAHRVKQIIESGELGNVISIATRLKVPRGAMPKDDIRFQYPLGGGACMDLTYVFSSCCFLGAADITAAKFTVHEAVPRKNAADPRVDDAMTTRFTLAQPGKPDIECRTDADMSLAPKFGVLPNLVQTAPLAVIELEKVRIEFKNYVAPHLTHSIVITEKDASGQLKKGTERTEKVYADGPLWGTRGQKWWSTYRYMLEAFVDAVRAKEAGKEVEGKGSGVGPWMSGQESEKLMELIDAVYDKAGMPRRGQDEKR